MAIFKKRGKWGIDYRVNGKRYRELVGDNKKLAKEVLSKRLAEAAEQTHFPGRQANACPFSEVAEKYWDLHGSTLRQRGLPNMFREIVAALGGKAVGAITAEDIQRHLQKVAARASKSTVNRHLTVIRSIFSKAIYWKLLYGENPCRAIKKHREPTHKLRYLSRDEMERLLNAAHARLYPVLVCALMTGMRRSEILGLQWENVDVERGFIYVLQSKSDKGREVPISSKLRDSLLSLGPKTSGSVFQLPYIMLRRYFDKALRDSGVHNFRFHDLRHTFASWFMMKGGNIYTLQKLLSHSTIAMTTRYAHLGRGHLASEMAMFESAIPTKSAEVEGKWAHIGHSATSPSQASSEKVC